MYNFELTSPIYLILLIIYFATSSLKQLEIRFNKAYVGLADAEMIKYVYRRPKLPNWIHFIFILDWLIAITLFVLNWQVALVILLIKFVLSFLPILETFGNILLLPFQPKFPEGVSDEHLDIASEIRIWADTPTESKNWNTKYDVILEKLRNLGFKDDNDKFRILDALNYLRVDEFTKLEATNLYHQEKANYLSEKAWEAEKLKAKKEEEEWEEQQKQWKEAEEKEREEFEEIMRQLDENLDESSEFKS
ncbi:hypothetical protein BH20ACI1_BH20ACI1_15810 [soil metagenome]